MIGEVLGSYRVIAKLGAGGMGTVWLAEHQLLGSRAAIKVLLPDLSQQDTIVQRFFDEARAATRIHDPGIVTVLDFGWHQGEAYLVMELLIGQTLTQRLGYGTLPPVTAVRYIQLAGLAMVAAHARGIIHRDLKPDNLFVVADPAVPGGERIKVLDFGIAKLLDRRPGDSHSHRSTVTGAIMGTPAYMSPEQCRGAGEIDHRTDIYALGCVLFHLLTGRPPFIAPTPGDMIASHLRQEPPAPSTLVATGVISPELDALVLKCLAKERGARFATMSELVRAGAAITGDKHTLPSIAPMSQTHEVGSSAATQLTGASLPGAVPPTALPPPITTLTAGALSTASHPPRARSRARLLVLGATLIGTVATIWFVLARRDPSDTTADPGAIPPIAAAAPTADAAASPHDAPPFDAALVATPARDATVRSRPSRPDAGSTHDDLDHR